jgi:hypothetical protein
MASYASARLFGEKVVNFCWKSSKMERRVSIIKKGECRPQQEFPGLQSGCARSNRMRALGEPAW